MNNKRSRHSLDDLVGRVMLMQALTALCAVVTVALTAELMSVAAVACGAVIGIVLTWVTARSVSRSSEAIFRQADKAMLPLYSGMLQKLLIGGGGIYFAAAVLDLNLLFVIVGFILTQLGYLVVFLKTKN